MTDAQASMPDHIIMFTTEAMERSARRVGDEDG